MKFPIFCHKCLNDNIGPYIPCSSIDDINDQEVHEIVCERGHKCYYQIGNQKFDILFTLGIQAMSEGYYREAIVNFTSALERFYEYAITLMLLINEVPYEEVSDFYKNIGKHSERELGAFCSLYYMVRKVPPTLLSNSKRSFRNDVIHGGISPKYEKTLEYGDTIRNLIKDDYLFLDSNYPDAVYRLLSGQASETKALDIGSIEIISCGIEQYVLSDLSIEDMIKDIQNYKTVIDRLFKKSTPVIDINQNH